MKTLIEYLQDCRHKLGDVSKLKTMEHLGMSRQQWTAIEKGSGISEKNALRIADFLDIDPMEVIASSKILRGENREIREYWAKVGKTHTIQRVAENKGKYNK